MILSVEITPDSVEFLKRLRRHTGATSYKDLLNDAITLMGWAVKERQDGRVIASLDEASKAYKELQMASLEHASRFVESLDAVADDDAEPRGPELVEPRPLARAGAR